jgi:hypothetical protein
LNNTSTNDTQLLHLPFGRKRQVAHNLLLLLHAVATIYRATATAIGLLSYTKDKDSTTAIGLLSYTKDQDAVSTTWSALAVRTECMPTLPT